MVNEKRKRVKITETITRHKKTISEVKTINGSNSQYQTIIKHRKWEMTEDYHYQFFTLKYRIHSF